MAIKFFHSYFHHSANGWENYPFRLEHKSKWDVPEWFRKMQTMQLLIDYE